MVGADSVQSYIYFYHLGLGFNLPVLPDSLTDKMDIKFSQQEVLGRSAPQMTFSSAGPRTIGVSLKLHRQIFSLENPEIDSMTKKGYVILKDFATGENQKVVANDAADVLINALMALSYPKYLDAAKAIVPPSLLYRAGNEASIRGVPGSVTKKSSGPWLRNAKMGEVQIDFDITEVEPYSAQYVAQNGGLRLDSLNGISTTLQRSSVWQ